MNKKKLFHQFAADAEQEACLAVCMSLEIYNLVEGMDLFMDSCCMLSFNQLKSIFDKL
jgi:hypothetical protein